VDQVALPGRCGGGLYAVALVSGLTDVDAITLSGLRLFGLRQIDVHSLGLV
jgi:uncharacterized membrane protein (DUF4010 family)